MKIIFSLICVGFIYCFWQFGEIGNSGFMVPSDGITFHKVDLVCGAAKDIGCGSRSKPVLRDLEKLPTVKEAWLNRSGTVVSIVWNDSAEPETLTAVKIFRDHGKSMNTLTGKAHEKQLMDFNTGKWYKGDQVDELSMEEAGRIANQLILPLVNDGILSKEDQPDMFAEVEKYIQDQFMRLKDVSLLNDPDYYGQWATAIQEIAGNYIPEEQIPEIQFSSPSNSSCSVNSKKCCAKGSKCCSPASWFSSLFK